MKHFEIKSWKDESILYAGEAETLKDLVNTAVKNRASLVGARLDGARLDGARFDGASFVGASFVGASFDGARFDGASFVGASFVGASFVGASFDGARFDGARLDGASLVGASFDGARLDGASFVGASFAKGKILSLRVLSGLYKYTILIYVLKDGKIPCVKMGCLDKTLAEWDAIGGIRKSNKNEFPDDGSPVSEQRARAFEYAKSEAIIMAEQVKDAP
jgi:uncharacterized protein YjbI with pentapeptide repeats